MSLRTNNRLREERDKYIADMGELHIAKDQAELEVGQLKRRNAELEAALASTKENAKMEKDARIGWEGEARRLAERYETPDSQINAATSKAVITNFLRDERCGNFFTRVSEPVAGEAFSLMEKRVQEIYPEYQLPEDLQTTADAAKTAVYPWDGGEFDLAQLTAPLPEEEQETEAEPVPAGNEMVDIEQPESSVQPTAE